MCRSCGLRFIDERPDEKQQATLYNDADAYRRFVEAERSVDGFLERHLDWACRLSQVVEPAAFTDLHGRRPQLLDIGCGSGDFLVVVRDRGFAVDGVELSAAAGDLAREFHQLDIQVGDYRSNQRVGYYQAVTLIGVVEHVIDPTDLLRHAATLLAPRGVLLIYTPVWGAYDRLAGGLARLSGGRWSRFIDRRINSAHLQIFPQHTLTKLLEAQGLVVHDTQRVCEYNLPVRHYLDSMSVGAGPLGRFAASAISRLVTSNLFFRNNQRVLAFKPA